MDQSEVIDKLQARLDALEAALPAATVAAAVPGGPFPCTVYRLQKKVKPKQIDCPGIDAKVARDASERDALMADGWLLTCPPHVYPEDGDAAAEKPAAAKAKGAKP